MGTRFLYQALEVIDFNCLQASTGAERDELVEIKLMKRCQKYGKILIVNVYFSIILFFINYE